MEDTPALLKFDSASSVTGLDFIARSLVILERNGTFLNPREVAGNMTQEQREIFLTRLDYHRNRAGEGEIR